MILGDPELATDAAATAPAGITIDELLRHAAARQPDAVALVDIPDGAGEARRLSYAEADRMVSAIAGRLRQLSLPTDAIVGIQLPQGIETILALLGVLRAGMIAAPLPLLWRRADVIAALARVGAKALITCKRAGNFEHALFATRVAAELFSIRYVCGFGGELPDGVVPLDDLLAAPPVDPVPPVERSGNAAAHLAVITFEIGQEGPLPVARRHLELFAAGLGVVLESRLQQQAGILSTLAPSSFAGLSLTLIPWLLTGGKLVLHSPFDAKRFAHLRRDEGCSALVVPAPVAFYPGAIEQSFDAAPATVLAAWHAPEGLAGSADWHAADLALVDVAIFGEAGLIPGRRGADGRPLPLPLGPVEAPRDGVAGFALGEIGVSESGTLALRGAMVPRHAFPPGIERSDQPHFGIGPDGMVDTGYLCTVDPPRNVATVTAAPADIVTVGGYRLPLRGLSRLVGRLDSGATLTVQADPLLGQRLVGSAANHEYVRVKLVGMGLNPLVASAFADRAPDRVEPPERQQAVA